MKPLCAACRVEEEKWVNIKPETARAIAAASDKPAIVTIQSQLRLIRGACRENH